MARVVVTGQVGDAAKWEEGFRTHGDLFRKMTVRKPIHFTATAQNEMILYIEPDDLDKYLEVLDSRATEEAMKFDGVKRDTVRIFVLDKQFDPRK